MKDVLKVVLVLGKLYLGIGYGFSFALIREFGKRLGVLVDMAAVAI